MQKTQNFNKKMKYVFIVCKTPSRSNVEEVSNRTFNSHTWLKKKINKLYLEKDEKREYWIKTTNISDKRLKKMMLRHHKKNILEILKILSS